MSWRRFANWAKHKPFTLRIADRLGRSRGRLAVLDRCNPPPPSRLKIDFSDWQKHQLAAAWIGHATVILRIGGMTVLTDPVFSSRIGIGLGMTTAGPRRLVAAATTIAELSPIDLMLISHAHFDHLDRPSLAKLPKRVPVIAAAHTADLLRDLSYRNVTELPWTKSKRVGSLTITAMPVQHWGARTFHDTHRTYNAYKIVADDGASVLFGGDSAYTDVLDSAGPVDLAILGIGAYDPYVAAHATPEQAWLMAKRMGAKHLLPMHHSTFRLSYEPTGEPIERLLKAAGDERRRVVITEVGGMWVQEPGTK
jgi:L-ascorbate metabolism protein UlaG (beta-lactamase superfamily)